MFGLFTKKIKLDLEEEKAIVASIRAVEKHCTAEIQVHLASRIKKGIEQDAKIVFKKLKLFKTEHRNGVLIYVIPPLKKFIVLGDIGIHSKVKQDFWEEVTAEMSISFKESDITTGIIKGIELAGKKLIEYFPATGKSNPNELSDEISRS